MKLITKNTDYAIQALVYIALNKDKSVSARNLSETLEVPWSFLRRILQILSKNGYIKSLKGRGGGFILSQDPGNIALLNIIELFQGDFSLTDCMIRGKICKNINSCLLRFELKNIENIIYDRLKNITIKSLVPDKNQKIKSLSKVSIN